MHRLLKFLYIRRVSAVYRFAIFRDVTYKLHLHHSDASGAHKIVCYCGIVIRVLCYLIL